MNPPTDELIEAYLKDHPRKHKPYCYDRGQLQGRLDVLEEWHITEAEHNIENKCCFLGKEISKIKSALNGQEKTR